MSGFFGSIFQWGGGLIVFPLSLMELGRYGGSSGATCFWIGVIFVVTGSYMRYASAHAVRISR